MVEVNYLFSMAKASEYELVITYSGEVQMDQSGEQEVCEYYSLFLAIDTVKRIRDELTCLTPAKESEKLKNLFRDVPAEISSRDMQNGEYKLSTFTVMRYPEDYQAFGSPSPG